jgi:hypothetical protein
MIQGSFKRSYETTMCPAFIIYSLFNDAVGSSGAVASNGRIISDKRTRKGYEGSSCGYLKEEARLHSKEF